MSEEKTFWADTDFFGLLGRPVRKSLSAAMHNANFRALGMNALYTPYDVGVEDLPRVLPALEALRFRGLNVTMPLKQEIIKYLDGLDEAAALCNAVNTVFWKDGRLWGSNTDGIGFVHGLKEQGGYDPSGRRCLLFGAGGAARGVAFALCDAGIESISLWGRPSGRERILRLADELNSYRSGVCRIHSIEGDDVPKLLRENELIVNGTSVGMAPETDASIFDTSLLESRHMVCDLVYIPHETRMLREAKAAGAGTLAGYWMIIRQGAEAFRRWTGGMEPDVGVMTRSVLDRLSE